MNLHFVRSGQQVDTGIFYSHHPVALVIADLEGWNHLLEKLRAALDGERWERRAVPESAGMHLIVFPPAKKPAVQGRLKFLERPVGLGGGVRMQLMIYGNVVGYQLLINMIGKFGQRYLDCEGPHLHIEAGWVECSNLKVVPPSVYLNIQSPCTDWDDPEFKGYRWLTENRQPETLFPEGVRRSLAYKADFYSYPTEEIDDPAEYGEFRLKD